MRVERRFDLLSGPFLSRTRKTNCSLTLSISTFIPRPLNSDISVNCSCKMSNRVAKYDDTPRPKSVALVKFSIARSVFPFKWIDHVVVKKEIHRCFCRSTKAFWSYASGWQGDAVGRNEFQFVPLDFIVLRFFATFIHFYCAILDDETRI